MPIIQNRHPHSPKANTVQVTFKCITCESLVDSGQMGIPDVDDIESIHQTEDFESDHFECDSCGQEYNRTVFGNASDFTVDIEELPDGSELNAVID